MKFLSLIILLLCIIPLNTYSSFALSNKQESKSAEKTIINSSNINEDYSHLLKVYVNSLIVQAENDGNNTYSLKWKKILNLPGNQPDLSQYYYGLYYGAAGIGNTFLDLYQNNRNDSYLTIAERVGNYLVTNAKTSKFGYGWFKAEQSIALYSSEKYGLAGIASFLLSLYQQSSNQTFLEYAESTLNLLYNTKQITDYGFLWNYRIPESSPITDYIYGVTGIAKAYLKAYQVTSNTTYLAICINSTLWVLNQTEYNFLGETGMRRILYSPDPSYSVYFTGYQSGASGIGDFLLQLYNVTKNKDYLLFSKQMANWLVYKEEGKGFWSDYNAVDYLTDQYTKNNEGTFLGYSAGSAGVGIYFMNLFEVTQDNKYLGPVVRIKAFLQNEELKNGSQLYWKDQITGNYADRIETGLSLGQAGIGLFFANYYKLFGGTDVIETLQGINNFYSNITTIDGLVPYLYNNSIVLYDSSYLEGLAGIITFFNVANSTLGSIPLYDQSMLANLGGIDVNTSTSWTNCYDNGCFDSTGTTTDQPVTSSLDMYSIFAFLVIPLVKVTQKKKKKEI